MCTHRVAIKTIKEKESARFAIFASAPTKGEYNNHYAVLPSELADCRFIVNDRDDSCISKIYVYLLTRMRRFSVSLSPRTFEHSN